MLDLTDQEKAILRITIRLQLCDDLILNPNADNDAIVGAEEEAGNLRDQWLALLNEVNIELLLERLK